MVAKVSIIPDDSSKPTLTLRTSDVASFSSDSLAVTDGTAVSEDSLSVVKKTSIGSVIVGRNSECKIQDVRVSRKHARITLGCADSGIKGQQKLEIKLEIIGKHPCWVNDVMLKGGAVRLLRNGDKLSLLPGSAFTYRIHYKVAERPKICTETHDDIDETPVEVLTEPPKKVARLSLPVESPEKQVKVLENEVATERTSNDVIGLNRKFDKKKCSSLMDYFKKSPPKASKSSGDRSMEKKQSAGSSCSFGKGSVSKMSDGTSSFSFKLDGMWKNIESGKCYAYIPGDFEHSRKTFTGKLAGFDMDGTLISTKSGKTFPVDVNDWKILLPGGVIEKKLQQLASEDFVIAIFTNQNGISTGKQSLEDIKTKIQNIMKAIQLEVFVLVAPAKNLFRKPLLGGWNYLCDFLTTRDGHQSVQLGSSFYVGDAAGRPVNPATGRKKDFSCSDRLFALNAGVEFLTPEDFFLSKATETFEMPKFNPSKCVQSACEHFTLDCQPLDQKKGEKELVVLVGYPGSGKSTLANVFQESGYALVSRDHCGTVEKCLRMCKDFLNSSKSVIVDNTNPDKASRSKFISLGKSVNIPVRCLIMSAEEEQCLHNERFRSLTQPGYKPLPYLAYAKYKKSFEEPSVEEGFRSVARVPFVPRFKDEASRKFYSLFLLEK